MSQKCLLKASKYWSPSHKCFHKILIKQIYTDLHLTDACISGIPSNELGNREDQPSSSRVYVGESSYDRGVAASLPPLLLDE